MTNKLLIIDYHKGMNYWDVFRYPFSLQPDKVKATVLATIALHTWLKSEVILEKFTLLTVSQAKKDLETCQNFERVLLIR